MSVKMIDSLRSGDGTYVLANVAPELSSKLAPVLPQMQQALSGGPDGKLRLVEANFKTFTAIGGTTTSHSYLAYELDQGNRHALVRIGIQHYGQAARITDLYVNDLTKPVSELTAFTLVGKSATQYVFLALAALSFATILTSLFVLFLSKGIKRKWLWAIGCLFGFGQFAVDWSTGTTTFSPLYFQLFGAFAVKLSMLSAWRVGFGIPVFAIAFLIVRRRLQARSGPVESKQSANG